MNRYIILYILIFGSVKCFSQNKVYILLDENDKVFNQKISNVTNINKGYIKNQTYFSIEKNIKKTFKSIKDELSTKTKWMKNNLKFTHIEYVDTLYTNNIDLKRQLINEFKILFENNQNIEFSNDLNKISIDSIYLKYEEIALKIDEINKEQDKLGFNSLSVRLYNLYNNYRFYNFKKLENIKDLSVVKLRKYSCFKKFNKLKKKIYSANNIFMIVNNEYYYNIYEVSLIKKEFIQ